MMKKFSFSFLHNFMNRRFILTVDHSKLSILFFYFLVENFHLSLKGNILCLLKLPATLFLHLGGVIK